MNDGDTVTLTLRIVSPDGGRVIDQTRQELNDLARASQDAAVKQKGGAEAATAAYHNEMAELQRLRREIEQSLGAARQQEAQAKADAAAQKALTAELQRQAAEQRAAADGARAQAVAAQAQANAARAAKSELALKTAQERDSVRVAKEAAAAGGEATSALKGLAGAIGGMLGALATLGAAVAAVKAGFEFNSQIESMKLGISAIVSAQNTITDSQGRQLEGTEKLAAAQGLVGEVFERLKQDAIDTTATLPQLVSAFNAALAPATAAKMTLDETRQVTVGLVQAAGAVGVPMDQIRQEVQSILRGQMDNNTVLKDSLNISNDQIRNWTAQGTLAKNLLEVLKDFMVAGKQAGETWEGVTSTFKDNWNSLMGLLTKGAFDELKRTLAELNAKAFGPQAKSEAIKWGQILQDGVAGAITMASALGQVLLEGARMFGDSLNKIREMGAAAGAAEGGHDVAVQAIEGARLKGRFNEIAGRRIEPGFWDAALERMVRSGMDPSQIVMHAREKFGFGDEEATKLTQALAKGLRAAAKGFADQMEENTRELLERVKSITRAARADMPRYDLTPRSAPPASRPRAGGGRQDPLADFKPVPTFAAEEFGPPTPWQRANAARQALGQFAGFASVFGLLPKVDQGKADDAALRRSVETALNVSQIRQEGEFAAAKILEDAAARANDQDLREDLERRAADLRLEGVARAAQAERELRTKIAEDIGRFQMEFAVAAARMAVAAVGKAIKGEKLTKSDIGGFVGGLLDTGIGAVIGGALGIPGGPAGILGGTAAGGSIGSQIGLFKEVFGSWGERLDKQQALEGQVTDAQMVAAGSLEDSAAGLQEAAAALQTMADSFKDTRDRVTGRAFDTALELGAQGKLSPVLAGFLANTPIGKELGITGDTTTLTPEQIAAFRFWRETLPDSDWLGKHAGEGWASIPEGSGNQSRKTQSWLFGTRTDEGGSTEIPAYQEPMLKSEPAQAVPGQGAPDQNTYVAPTPAPDPNTVRPGTDTLAGNVPYLDSGSLMALLEATREGTTLLAGLRDGDKRLTPGTTPQNPVYTQVVNFADLAAYIPQGYLYGGGTSTTSRGATPGSSRRINLGRRAQAGAAAG